MKLAFCLFAGLILSLSVLVTGGSPATIGKFAEAELLKKTYSNLDFVSNGE